MSHRKMFAFQRYELFLLFSIMVHLGEKLHTLDHQKYMKYFSLRKSQRRLQDCGWYHSLLPFHSSLFHSEAQAFHFGHHKRRPNFLLILWRMVERMAQLGSWYHDFGWNECCCVERFFAGFEDDLSCSQKAYSLHLVMTIPHKTFSHPLLVNGQKAQWNWVVHNQQVEKNNCHMFSDVCLSKRGTETVHLM